MKKIISITLLACIVFASLLAIVSVISFFTGYEIYRNVSYGDAPCEVMDVYIPNIAYEREYNGCVLFIHGGSWSGGDKKEEELRCRSVANNGYIAASINYTLYSDETKDKYNVGIVLDEIDMALAYIKDLTAEMGINVNMAATAGYSAGAHLSMLYSYSRGSSAPLEIKFTANMAGPADISPEIWGNDLSIVIGERLSGMNISEEDLISGEADEILTLISPVSYVNSDTPPSIFVYGGNDTTVSCKNGEALKQKFDTAGVEYNYILLPNANHALLRNPIKRISYPIQLIKYCEMYFN